MNVILLWLHEERMSYLGKGSERLWRMMAASAILLSLSLGCEHTPTPPAKHNVDNSEVFDVSKDEVWQETVAVFAQRNLPISIIERDSGLIVLNNMSVSNIEFSAYADCGEWPSRWLSNNRVALNVHVTEVPQKRSSVSVNTNYKGYWWKSGENGNWVSCTSRGLLEAIVLDWIGTKIGIPTADYLGGDTMVDEKTINSKPSD